MGRSVILLSQYFSWICFLAWGDGPRVLDLTIQDGLNKGSSELIDTGRFMPVTIWLFKYRPKDRAVSTTPAPPGLIPYFELFIQSTVVN